MKTLAEFFSKLADSNIQLHLDGDRLRCKAPQGAMTDDIRAELADRKAEIIASLAGVANRQSVEPTAISRTDRNTDLPLSFAQQRLWFIDQFEGPSATYNIPAAVELNGDLNLQVLQQALREIIRRHEALRTTFDTKDGSPIQVIAAADEVTLPLPIVDLISETESEKTVEVQQLAMEEADRPFDLANGPLIRVSLLRHASDRHVLLLTVHHIVSDGWSMGVIVHELAALYAAALAQDSLNPFETKSPLPDLAIQYPDFAVWQREWLTGETLDRQLSFWKSELRDCPVQLELPTDRPRPAVQTFEGAVERFAISSGLTLQLEALSRESGATLYMTLLSAFGTLLSRYSGQTDVVIGSPIANRNRAELESLIGFFVNTIPMRVDLSENPNVPQLLAQVKRRSFDAFAHQDVPFEKLVDEIRPERNLSHSPIFQVMFALQNAPMDPLELPGLTLTPLQFDSQTSKFDLTLVMEETDAGLSAEFEFNTDLFDRATVQQMANHLQALLAGMVNSPDRPVGQIPMLSDAERQQIVFDWNSTRADFSGDKCLHQLFEEQVERTPNATAAIHDGQSLTYEALNEQANQLAHQLRQLGVRSGDHVAVTMERSLEMIPAVMGILKSGAAYVPIDPSYPAARKHWILSSMQIQHLVTQSEQLSTLTKLDELSSLQHVVCLDPKSRTALVDGFTLQQIAETTQVWQAKDLSRQAKHNPSPINTSDDTAYIIFTSGSTGTPKGVVVKHRPVINLIEWVNRKFDVNSADRLLFITSLCFDLSVYDVFGILAAGGSIHVASSQELRDPERLVHTLTHESITFWDSAPAALQQLVPLFPKVATPGLTDRLRLVFLSGDWIPVPLPDQIRNVFTGTKVVSLGGATEAAIWSNYYPIGKVDPAWPSIPYGKPIQNAKYYVLDANREPCPIGVPGDLFIGGDVLANGYTDAELTAERFVPDPFVASFPGENNPPPRMYNTGDRARFWADGNMEFLGRNDHQVKIRGFRIELGEIEAVLNQHSKIRDAVVQARDDHSGQKRLVAYVVPNDLDTPPTTDELRQFLKHKLPEYMVPWTFVTLQSLPVTSNGKLDRKALPAPDASNDDVQDNFVAAETDEQITLAKIWSDVLGRDNIGIHDNFFELGGDSILSIQIVARANQSGLRITPYQVFQYQTIAELSAVATEAIAIDAEQGMVTGEVPLTPIQRWFFEQNSPQPNHFNQALMLKIPADVDDQRLSSAIHELLNHHDALRLRFASTTRDWQQINSKPDGSFDSRTAGATQLSTIDLSDTPSDQQTAAIKEHAARIQGSLDIADGPLLAATRFRLGGVENDAADRLLVVVHHLAIDGVSWRVLLEDLETAYVQLSEGADVTLPAKTTAFRDWARRLNDHANTEQVIGEVDYWDDVTTDFSPLPRDIANEEASNTESSEEQVVVELDEERTRQLLHEVSQAYHTEINDVLLAALSRCMSTWTGDSSLTLDLEGHGREELFEDVDLSRTVGWFTTIYPVRIALDAGEDSTDNLGDLLMSVKEQLRAIPNRGIGYGLLRYLQKNEAVRARFRSTRNPEVNFNYLGRIDQGFENSSLLRLASESTGPSQSGKNRRAHVLGINAFISGDKLQCEWTYSRNLHDRSTIENLATAFIDSLQALIEHCQSPDAGGYTPSDFSLANLDSEQLEALSELLD